MHRVLPATAALLFAAIVPASSMAQPRSAATPTYVTSEPARAAMVLAGTLGIHGPACRLDAEPVLAAARDMVARVGTTGLAMQELNEAMSRGISTAREQGTPPNCADIRRQLDQAPRRFRTISR